MKRRWLDANFLSEDQRDGKKPVHSKCQWQLQVQRKDECCAFEDAKEWKQGLVANDDTLQVLALAPKKYEDC
jgi:hypothetical protein